MSGRARGWPRRRDRFGTLPWPDRRFSKIGFGGLVYVAVTMFTAIGAINSQNNLLFWIFGAALGVVLASGLVGGSGMMGLRAGRKIDSGLRVGEATRVRYTLENANRKAPAMALTIQEQAEGNAITPGLAAAARVGPHERVKCTGWMLPTRRGRVVVDGFTIQSTFPIGLILKRLWFEQPTTLIVRPPRMRLSGDLLRRVLGDTGRDGGSSRAVGAGEEFFGLREYRPGDPLRRVAWSASAKGDGYRVSLHSRPAPRALWVVVGTEPSAATGSGKQRGEVDWRAESLDDPHETALAAAAAALEAAHRAGMAFGLRIPAVGAVMSTAHGEGHLQACLDVLGACEAGAGGPDGGWTPGAREGCLYLGAGSGAAPAGATVVDITDKGKFFGGWAADDGAPGGSGP